MSGFGGAARAVQVALECFWIDVVWSVVVLSGFELRAWDRVVKV